MLRLLFCAVWLLAAAAATAQSSSPNVCESANQRAPASAGRVTLLSHTTLPRAASGPTQHLGGISGIDFDPDSSTWWLLSDDKNEHAAARAYPARIDVTAKGDASVRVGEPVALPLYPGEQVDPEALRRHPCSGLWAWASEGHVAGGQAPSVRWLQWPGFTHELTTAWAAARPLGALALPPSLLPHATSGHDVPTGPRHNRNIEGLAFTPAADALWVAMEGPLLQDGPEPDVQRGAQLRFTRLPLAGGPAAQYVYPLDRIHQPATGGRMRADNGVSEILAFASGELLVVERNGYEVADSRWAFGVRLFIADARQATDVSAVPGLAGADIRPMRKRLLLDLSTLGLPQLDNIEAAAWGPRLPDGRAVLVLMSDDNFAPNQVTQLIVLAVEEAPGPTAITLLHTNDHHGRFWRNAQGEGGLAVRQTVVDAVRAEVAAAGGHVLLLDAGDVNTGTPESDLQAAEPDFRGMSRLRYDAMAVGNHEFDRLPELQAKQWREWSTFPWLSANIERDGQPMFEPYRVVHLGSVRVAVLGLTTEDALLMGVTERYTGVSFKPAISAAQEWVPQLRRKADVVVALSHLGHYPDGRHGTSAPGDVTLARSVPGIDVIVGGHSHSLVCMLQENLRNEAYVPDAPCAPDQQNGTWIVQAGDRGRFIGRADFLWQEGHLTLQRYRLLPLNLRGSTQQQTEEPGMLALLQPFQATGAATLDEVVGFSAAPWNGERDGIRHRRGVLGNLIAEALREAGQADAAVLSSGGIRASLPAGPIRRRDLLTTLPFGNRLVVVRLSGAELLSHVQAWAGMTPGSGAFAQYSGLSFEHGEGTVRNLRIAGRPADPRAVYRLAMHSFIAQGGDGYPDMRQHPGYADTGLIDIDVLREFISRRGTVRVVDFDPDGLIDNPLRKEP